MTPSDGRRKRFEAGHAKYGMTPAKTELLYHVARFGMLTTRQVVLVSGKGKSGIYKHLSDLKDHGMVQPWAAPLGDFADTGTPASPGLLGVGQNLYVATKAGIKWLIENGYVEDEAELPVPTVPKRGLFLAHEVLVRDVRIWLEICARDGGELLRWEDGEAAHFTTVRPDAWFAFQLPNGKKLVAMVEADRATMRGDRMAEKARAYAKLLGSEELVAKVGRANFRVLAVTLSPQRRDRVVADMAIPELAGRLFAAAVPDLAEGGFSRPAWQVPGQAELVPMVPESALSPG